MTDTLFADETASYASSSFPEPREFQIAAHQALRQGVRDGHRCQVLMSPTGSGKTYLGLRIIHEALLRGKRCCFLVDRTTLIEQTSRVADAYGLSAHGIIQAGHWRTNLSLPFQIASQATIAQRNWPEFDVIVVDESHTLYKSWTEHIPNIDAVVIGLSATPFAKGMGLLFSNLVNAATMDELTRSGVLVPMRVFTCTAPDMKGAKLVAGEWSDKEAEQRGMKIIGDVVSEWVKFGEGRKTIVFGATIAHCEEMVRQFNAAGIKAATFTSHTDAAEREALLEEYRKPDSAIRVLVSVEALAKGFDVPDVGCVVDCRPLRKSLSTAIQMWGRGLRSSQATGKTNCLLLDHSGNFIRFAKDFEDIYFNGLSHLDAGEKLDKEVRKDEEKEPSACPKCGHIPMFKKCVQCGHEVHKASTVEVHAGEMREVVMSGKKKLADDHRHLYDQLVTHNRGWGKPETVNGRTWHQFKAITGSAPPREWRADTAPNVEVTRAVVGKIKQMQIAYRAGKSRATA